MKDNWLVIRADAGSSIGVGHVIRCLALAQAWQDSGGRAVFISSCAGTALGGQLESAGFPVVTAGAEPGSAGDAARCAEIVARHKAAWLVADGYRFGGEFQSQVREAGIRLLLLDDYGSLDAYQARIVLNQNASAGDIAYPEGPRLLLGTRYALLRRQFLGWRGTPRTITPGCRKILVTLGGADPDNVTRLVLDALNGITDRRFEINLVAGSSNPHTEALERAAAASSHRVVLERDVRDIERLMLWADLAISAGGSTCWELAFLGLPAIIVVLAENQRRIAEVLHEQGVAINLGPGSDLRREDLADLLTSLCADPELRGAMSERGRALVDGRGASRVVKVLQEG